MEQTYQTTEEETLRQKQLIQDRLAAQRERAAQATAKTASSFISKAAPGYGTIAMKLGGEKLIKKVLVKAGGESSSKDGFFKNFLLMVGLLFLLPITLPLLILFSPLIFVILIMFAAKKLA